MRDISRIPKFSEEFTKIWEENFPDWRAGQLWYNFFNWLMYEKHIDPFFPEEDRMIEYFKEFVSKEVKTEMKNINDFEKTCREKLVEWYNSQKKLKEKADLLQARTIWVDKDLSKWNGIFSLTVGRNRIFAEYVYDTKEKKLYSTIFTEAAKKYYPE